MTRGAQRLLPSEDGPTAAVASPPSYGTTDPGASYFDTRPDPPPTLRLQIPIPRENARMLGEEEEVSDEDDEELDDDDADKADAEQNAGIHKATATQEVFQRSSKRILLFGIGLAAYIHSLDSTTLLTFPTFAASAFNAHGLLGAIQVSQAVVLALGKPIIAKLADASSRGTAFLFVICLYALGYIIAASAQSIQVVIGGVVFYSVAQSSLQLLNQILIADYSTLSTRGLFSALATAPFLVNAPVGAWLGAALLQSIGWRSGYLVFALVVPACLCPIVVTLLWAERRVSTLALAPASAPASAAADNAVHPRLPRGSSSSPLMPVGGHHGRQSSRFSTLSARNRTGGRWARIVRFGAALDVPGLILLAASIALVLVPLALSRPAESAPAPVPDVPPATKTAQATLDAHSMAARSMMARSLEAAAAGGLGRMLPLLLTGCALFGAFLLWDLRYASSPVVPGRFWSNKPVLIAASVGFFDFVSFFLTFTYLFSYVLVSRPWSMGAANTFMQVQGFSMTVCAIIAGWVMRRIRRFKPVLTAGLWIRLAGVLAIIPARGKDSSTVALVATQLLQGVGGGTAFIAAQVGAQASVAQRDVAIVTAVVLLLAEIGGAVGGALAGAIWVQTMPAALAEHLPDVSAETRAELFGSIAIAIKYPLGHPIREGVIAAYDETMKRMLLAAAVVAVMPVLLALAMPDWPLSDKRGEEDDGERRRRSGSIPGGRSQERP